MSGPFLNLYAASILSPPIVLIHHLTKPIFHIGCSDLLPSWAKIPNSYMLAAFSLLHLSNLVFTIFQAWWLSPSSSLHPLPENPKTPNSVSLPNLGQLYLPIKMNWGQGPSASYVKMNRFPCNLGGGQINLIQTLDQIYNKKDRVGWDGGRS